MVQPRTKPPETRREELMNAAERLFLKRGVDATSVEQITTAAKVAKGTFYLYFPTKEAVLAALEERFAQDHHAKIAAAVARKRPDDWTGKLAAWAKAGVATYLDAIQLHDVLFFGARPITREGLVQNIVIDHLAELLESAAEAGAWAIDHPRTTAVFLFSGLHAMVDDAYCREKQVNRARLIRQAERLFLRAVGGLIDA
jgi:AcrR family transcriptional regulator